MNFEPECEDKKKRGKIYKIDQAVLNDIFYVLKNSKTRQIYDKTERFVNKKNLKKAPTDGMQYFEAFGELKNYAMFVILSLMLIQQHQHFAKQMTIGGLLAFAYMTVELRMPKEVNQDENVVI